MIYQKITKSTKTKLNDLARIFRLIGSISDLCVIFMILEK